MKKLIGLGMGCLLGGCTPKPYNAFQSPNPDKLYPYQDIAPLPGVHVLPSERAIAYKEVDFYFVAQHIRRSMVVDLAKFRNVNLVLVDYTVLPPTKPLEELMKPRYDGQKYCKKYILKPERYFLSLSFYECGNRPPAPPLFMGTAVMNVTKAPPFEAVRFMVHDIVMEHIRTPVRNIVINLD